MKFRLIITICLLYIFIPPIYSQWTWQNPLPQGNLYTSLCFSDSLTGFAIGEGHGNNIKTTDGGATWNIESFSLTYYFTPNVIYFLNKEIGFLIGSAVYKTTDGGNSWTNKTGNTSYSFMNSISFMNDSIGIIVGRDGMVLRTTDGGESWVRQKNLGIGNNNLASVLFVNSSTGYICGQSGIYTTYDGGNYWYYLSPISIWGDHNIYFTAEYTFYATSFGQIVKSTNGGINWITQYSNDSADMHSIFFADSLTGYVVGDKGIILKTTNGGTDWIAKHSNTAEELTSLFFTGKSTAFAAGTHGIILKTTDAGETWFEISKGTRNKLNSTYFPSANVGYTAGINGTILKTTNGGNDWISQTSGTSFNLNSICFTDSINGYAVGDSGTILKTTDGGENWMTEWDKFILNYSSVFFIDQQIGFIAGEKGTILKTTNGGVDWNVQTSFTDNFLNSIYFLDKNNGYTADSRGTLLMTSNGGELWENIFTGITDSLSCVYFTDLATGYLSMQGGVLKTTNSGGSWNPVLNIGFNFIKSIRFVDKNNGYAGGSLLFKTTDAGNTWLNISLMSLTSNYISDIYFTDAMTGYVVGDNGMILKTTSGGVTSIINNEQPILLTDYNLSQNYPNPFNPTSTINYSLPKAGNVKLTVYNIIGSKVATILNEYKPAGNYSAQFNGSNLASGIYLYRLESGSYSATKKLILLK